MQLTVMCDGEVVGRWGFGELDTGNMLPSKGDIIVTDRVHGRDASMVGRFVVRGVEWAEDGADVVPVFVHVDRLRAKADASASTLPCQTPIDPAIQTALTEVAADIERALPTPEELVPVVMRDHHGPLPMRPAYIEAWSKAMARGLDVVRKRLADVFNDRVKGGGEEG